MNLNDNDFLKLGFEKIDSQKWDAFGDFCVLYQKNGLKLRHISDRGELYLDVGLMSDADWFDIPLVAYCLNNAGEGILTIGEQYEFLSKHFHVMHDYLLLGSQMLVQERKHRQERRLKEVSGSYFNI